MFFFAVFAYLFLHGLSDRFFKYHGCKRSSPNIVINWILIQIILSLDTWKVCTQNTVRKCKVIMNTDKGKTIKLEGLCFAGKRVCLFIHSLSVQSWGLGIFIAEEEFFHVSHRELIVRPSFKELLNSVLSREFFHFGTLCNY